MTDHVAELQRRVYEDAAMFHEVRGLWRIMQDHAGTWTTPDERLAAAELLRKRLG